MLYIAKDSVDNALAWAARLEAAIQALGDIHGHAIDEAASDRLGSMVRKLVFEGIYLIHYELNEDLGRVDVINFRHGARLPRRGEP